jgi:formylglycine-generating enzyme required for sulfatase activity
VADWCWDWYWYGYYSAVWLWTNVYRGPASGTYRVCRGGAWSLVARNCRVAKRIWDVPGVSHNSLGFRTVRPPVP